jgi:catechol 2,3-dioxygenase-like lactoylglutathione lyase family enzyme
MNTLGIRHIALNVDNPQISKDFYIRVMKMELEWEPDAENIYLTSQGHDNLALHQATITPDATAEAAQRVDHLGIAVPTLGDVDEWYGWVKSQNARILKEIKTHRDGARSFYLADPDGNIIQIIYHPPIAKRAARTL